MVKGRLSSMASRCTSWAFVASSMASSESRTTDLMEGEYRHAVRQAAQLQKGIYLFAFVDLAWDQVWDAPVAQAQGPQTVYYR